MASSHLMNFPPWYLQCRQRRGICRGCLRHKCRRRFRPRNDPFGHTMNSGDAQTTPGGSSRGSAEAVADTGGSIRIPSALRRILGFKPTFGSVGCCGIVPLAASFDHVCPLARGVLDVAIVVGGRLQSAVTPPQPNLLALVVRNTALVTLSQLQL